jgi:hypothetical protein
MHHESGDGHALLHFFALLLRKLGDVGLLA